MRARARLQRLPIGRAILRTRESSNEECVLRFISVPQKFNGKRPQPRMIPVKAAGVTPETRKARPSCDRIQMPLRILLKVSTRTKARVAARREAIVASRGHIVCEFLKFLSFVIFLERALSTERANFPRKMSFGASERRSLRRHITFDSAMGPRDGGCTPNTPGSPPRVQRASVPLPRNGASAYIQEGGCALSALSSVHHDYFGVFADARDGQGDPCAAAAAAFREHVRAWPRPPARFCG